MCQVKLSLPLKRHPIWISAECWGALAVMGSPAFKRSALGIEVVVVWSLTIRYLRSLSFNQNKG